ncbi:unnamed protein product [Blepharisma stoltei]|uniref:Uncharacterized protein n=1 Tax=Blepharisma stoltei TaxID=1481888 RepID=A0AAU9IHV4_9CILI|nr:unnamed protein product [Blepharisma stoltei]
MGCCQQHKSRISIIKPNGSIYSSSTIDVNKFLESFQKPSHNLLLSYYASNSKMSSAFKSFFEVIFAHDEDQITEIDLNFVPFGSDGIYHFQMMSQYFSCIKILKLSNIEILNVHIKRLSHSIEQMSDLEVLEIEGNKITAEGIQHLTPFKYLNKLKELYVGRNDIGAVGMRHLCSNLQNSENLEILSLKGNIIEDDGIVNLSKIVQRFPKLRVLNVCENSITDIGAKIIAKNFLTLEYLDLSRNNLNTHKFQFLLERNKLQFKL